MSFSAHHTFLKAITPLLCTTLLLGFNTYYFGAQAAKGPNQLALLLGGAMALLLHRKQKLTSSRIIQAIRQNCKPILPTFWFLLAVAAMSVAWLMSGITPAIIYYGLTYLEPKIFLLTTTLLCAIVSIATGSSWATIATLGIALLEIGKALGWSAGIVGGAIISGAYFGDKISPLSETTVMAASVTNTKLLRHIRAMLWTSIPTFLITLFIFAAIGYIVSPHEGSALATRQLVLHDLGRHFTITPYLFIVPCIVFSLIILQVPPLLTLCLGTIMGLFTLLLTAPPIMLSYWQSDVTLSVTTFFHMIRAIGGGIDLANANPLMADLLHSGGMWGMMPTLTLILAAIIMGALLEVTQVIKTITDYLKNVESTGSLILMTTVTGILLNFTVADQYLAILIGGKIYTRLFAARKLDSSNLSRTLEDAITVTSPLIPWNTCGAAQSTVLGITTFTYLPYALFNILSPLVGIVLAYLGIGIRPQEEKATPKQK